MAAPGVTIVISPLVALILDMVKSLNLKHGAGTAMHCLTLSDNVWVDDADTNFVEESVLRSASN